ncbi:MAG: hypothetical protein H7175_05425, partial [Burkholderiales bacterium]|nr:hypothetical protein [Anaerolineae bacterium]
MTTEQTNWRYLGRIVVKAALLFVLANVLFALLDPLPALGRVSLYNTLLMGRARLPYGENPADSYNLSLNSLDAMFASHEVSRPKAADEYRVLLIGESSVWGFLLRPDETLAANINAGDYTVDGRNVRAYNIGHPIFSLTKDLLLLDTAMQFQPDLVVWMVTLESLPREQQLFPPLVQNNADAVRRLIADYNLNFDPQDERFVDRSFIERTIVGRRRELADWLRLQLYGVAWSATGIDQHYPAEFDPRQEDFEADVSWHNLNEPQPLNEDVLTLDVLAAGIERVGATPIVIVNEPMFVSSGENSDL